MNKFSLIIAGILILSFPFLIHAQSFDENFDYPTGSFDALISNNTVTQWKSVYSGTSANIVNGSLSYSGYSLSGVGNMLNINGSGKDYRHDFSSDVSSGTVYYIFLLNVIDNSNLQGSSASGDYFMNFQAGSPGRGLLNIRQGSTNSVYQLGLQKSTSSTANYLTSKELNYAQTYLIVLAYTFNTGNSTDDQIQLWINPNLSGTKPAADLDFTDSQSDASYLSAIQIRQGSNTPNAYIDGIRTSQSWSTGLLPVEMKSFNCIFKRNAMFLKWTTATEVNNYGFNIERAAENPKYNSSLNWEKIGFVKGKGNSNSINNYSYVDDNISTGKYAYRLKMIDNDGKFTFSKIIYADVTHNLNYKLDQNYPNPFNPSTTIEFSIPKDSRVKVILFNSLGQKVKTLTDKIEQAGNHTIKFDANTLESGVYFYEMKAEGFREIKKMIVLK